MCLTKFAIRLCVLLVIGQREAIATSVESLPCTNKYMQCAPYNALCDCVDLEANMDCTTPAGATCSCDNDNRYFAVTYDTAQMINGQQTTYTTICELLSGNHLEKHLYPHYVGENKFQLKFPILTDVL